MCCNLVQRLEIVTLMNTDLSHVMSIDIQKYLFTSLGMLCGIEPRNFFEVRMSALHETNQPYKIFRLKQVIELTGLSRSTIYDLLNSKSSRHDSSFPKSIKLTECSVGWVSTEIYAWIDSRVAKSRS